MKNKTRKEIDELHAKIAPLTQRINDIEEEEILKVQKPRLHNMVGLCLSSEYSDGYYAKVLDLIEAKDGYPHFILEVCHMTKEGNPYMHLDNVTPYLNKEWWDSPFPVAGWKVCDENEYQDFKSKIARELVTQKSLRAWVKKLS